MQPKYVTQQCMFTHWYFWVCDLVKEGGVITLKRFWFTGRPLLANQVTRALVLHLLSLTQLGRYTNDLLKMAVVIRG